MQTVHVACRAFVRRKTTAHANLRPLKISNIISNYNIIRGLRVIRANIFFVNLKSMVDKRDDKKKKNERIPND